MAVVTRPPPAADCLARCTTSSQTTGEPLLGSAPGDRRWLLVEHAGPWGRRAVAESRLPAAVREHLMGLDDVRVQLIRQPGRTAEGVRVFLAEASEGGVMRVWAATLDAERDLLGVDPADPEGSGLTRYDEHADGPLLLVCTNGRRDRCCAELGRPVVAALAERWPAGTWETTHLGGHRFAATLVALPAGVALGRLDAGSAVLACAELVAGRVPADVLRGRVGLPPAAQVAEQQLRAGLGLSGLAEVQVVSIRPGDQGALVRLRAQGATHELEVVARPGPPVRPSCAEDATSASTAYRVHWTSPSSGASTSPSTGPSSGS